jgi:hypothetical protein
MLCAAAFAVAARLTADQGALLLVGGLAGAVC